MKRGVLDLKTWLYGPVYVSAIMAVGIDAQCGKAEFKIHYPNLGKSETPGDSAIIHPSKCSTKRFIHYSTTWWSER